MNLAEATRIVREAVKDKSYAATPIGLEVRRYYRWKKNEWGARPATLVDYESILSKLALFFGDLELRDLEPPVGTERLRECWQFHWGERSGRTRAKVRSVWVDFFDWGVREGKLHGNPARALTAPKKRDTEIPVFSDMFVQRVIGSQSYCADRIGCVLILRYGLRRGAILSLKLKHFDFSRRLLTVHTKGGRIYPIPIVEDAFWRDLGVFELEVGADPEALILYRQDTRKRLVPLEEAEEVLDLGSEKRGYAWVTKRQHYRTEPTGKLVHAWWYRCLERAGVVEKGVQSGMNMHRGRHTAITELVRSEHGGLKLAQLLAGHSDIKTTSRYAQMDTSDLERALTGMYGDAPTDPLD